MSFGRSCVFYPVIEEDVAIVGSVNIYEGARLYELREPVKALIEFTSGKIFSPEDETGPGEWCLDCIGVSAHLQGQGVGSQLLDFLIGHHVKENHQKIGLLVDKAYSNAKKLYLRKGFKVIGENAFGGKQMDISRSVLPTSYIEITLQ